MELPVLLQARSVLKLGLALVAHSLPRKEMDSRPIIQPYEPQQYRRDQLPGGMEPEKGVERFFDNMKRSPLPVTKWGIAGAIGGALLAGPYGGAAGVLAGLALEQHMQK